MNPALNLSIQAAGPHSPDRCPQHLPGRLVEEHDWRVVEQLQRDGEPLLLSPGEPDAARGAAGGQSQRLQYVIDLVAPDGGGSRNVGQDVNTHQ